MYRMMVLMTNSDIRNVVNKLIENLYVCINLCVCVCIEVNMMGGGGKKKRGKNAPNKKKKNTKPRGIK